MKKIILFLCVAITLTLSLIIVASAKSLSFYNHIEKDSQKVNFYFDSADIPKKHAKDAWPYFTYLSKKYHVNITKVTYVNEHKVLIHTTDNALKQQVGQNKKLEIFDSSLSIKVFPLKNINLTEEGIYQLKGKEKDIREVIRLINKEVGVVDKMDGDFLTGLSLDFFSTSLTLFLTILLFVVLFHHLLNQKEQLKILYDLGYRQHQIVKYIIQGLANFIWLYIVLSVILALLSYHTIYQDIYIYIALFIVLLVEVALLVLFYSFTAIVVHFFVKRYAKNKRSDSKHVLMGIYMLISAIAIVLIAMSTMQLITNFKDYEQQKTSLKHWNLTKNIYGTHFYDIGQVKNPVIDKEVSIKVKNYYLSPDNQGFIAEAENFSYEDGLFFYQLNEKENADIEADGKTIVLDENYLKRHPKKTTQGDNVIHHIKRDNKTLNILVPIKLKQYEQAIIANFKEYFTFKQNIEDESKRKKVDSSLNVHIIWMENDVDYFTYNAMIGGTKNTVVAPIAIIETGNIDPLDYGHYFSISYYFKSHLDNPYETIYAGLNKHKIDGVIRSVYAVYDTKVDMVNELKTEIYKYTGLALLTSITFILTTLTFIQIYFKSYQFPIFLKRSLGYSYWSIHKWMLLFLVMLHVLMGALLLTSHNMIAMSVFASITLIEALSVVFTFMKLNSENINLVLKGKKDD
ncbi:DUF1430 domain-containing protein [Staphylococcus americanisciuri]|uniref:DUF1430 domain-containing protein n=1 Tax=Staphylococcus americanisciuri TaxID=2973940 RepID=A0ABT2F306_9STAP|nr:DUF1430 domain-containing protein [Staphylococcus americanisciuri]MCS4486787.1 DUF1430 domain-containing protein [Staphylococcus americanisciuri]